MSEKSKGNVGDTSSSLSSLSSRIVKNPLLSASVTGLTFDDFQHKPLLLPAAPPVVATPTIASSVIEEGSSNLIKSERKSIISDIDSDTFSEINLNAPVDEDISQTSGNSSNPTIDNNNSQEEPTTRITDDSILSQAASSFSQLPAVASNVFSTFSKVIKDYSPNNNTRENSTERDTPKQETTFVSSTLQQSSTIPYFVPISNYPSQSVFDNQSIPEPPKFYSPTEIIQSSTTSSSIAPPPISGQQNTYRLSAKKKTYAPIPGITSGSSTTGSTVQNQKLSDQFYPSSNFPSQNQNTLSSNRVEHSVKSLETSVLTHKTEERKGLFSLSNFVPPVIQNLTGLVQTSSKSTNINENKENNVINQNLEPVNIFSRDQDQSSNISVTPQFYNPSNLTKTAVSTTPLPSLETDGKQNTNIQFTSVQFFNPGPLNQRLENSSFQKNIEIEENKFVSAVPETSIKTSVTNIFPTPSVDSNSTVQSLPSEQTRSETLQIQSQFVQPQQFDPSNFQSGYSNLSNTSFPAPTLSSNTPVQQLVTPQVQPPLPKPPTNTGSNTFRLQKGTRLYKSPFSSGNVHTSHASVSENYPSTAATQTLFSPFTEQTTQSITTVQPPPKIFNPLQLSSQDTRINEQKVLPSCKSEESSSSVLENITSLPAAAVISSEHTKQQNLIPTPNQIFNLVPQVSQDKEISFFDDSNVSPIEPQVFPHSENKTPSLLLPSKIFDSADQLIQEKDKRQQELPPVFVPNLSPTSLQEDSFRSDIETQNIPHFEITKQTNLLDVEKSSDETIRSDLQNIPEPSAPPAENLPKEGTPSVVSERSEIENFESEKFSKTLPEQPNIFQTVRAQQYNNPFESTNVSTSVSQLNSVFSSNDSNQNKIIYPSTEYFDVSKHSLESTNVNNNITENAQRITQQPQIFSLTNYFSEELNNNYSQQTHFITHPTINLSSTSVGNSRTDDFSQSPPPPISNYFTNQSTNNKSANNIQQSKPQVKANILTPPTILPVPPQLPDPLSFFDSFNNSTSVNSAENSPNNNSDTVEDPNSLRIQNFFNNPPQNNSDSISELNYRLVGSGVVGNSKKLENLTVESNVNEEIRAFSPLSNIVEPPSSSCSEFSSDFSQQQQLQQQKQLQQLRQRSQQQQLQQQQLPEYLTKLSYDELPDEIIEQLKMSNLNEENSKLMTNVAYRPVKKHWFYNKNTNKKPNWMPFSQHDSDILEENFLSPNGQEVVSVEGGRYDVNIKERKRTAVYWTTEPTDVRRCSWFYKSVDSKYVPYEEEIAETLEEEYKQASISGEWRRKVSLPSGENVTFHGPSVMVHFHHPQNADSWGGSSTTPARPRVVKRDVEDFNIDPGESSKVDHLLLMVHGIGSACDLKFRSLEEVVDEFRSIATQLIQSHYKTSCDNGDVRRVEVLPVSWHSELHSKESGIDERLKAITLESIPKLRNFTNDTLVDVLFYTSPIFCQNIINTVCTAMNSIYMKYCQRNPEFKGGVSLAGHSLGSLILFDLLCHQNPVENIELQNSENPDQVMQPFTTTVQNNHTEQISYTVGSAGTGQPFISYPQLIFQPKKFFALGSPIGMFVTIRGIDKLGLDFKLPTCPGFYNIFHPYDPVAYRLEALINPDLSGVRPVLISHHKGRKRMHLELKETMTRVSADLKQKIVDTFKNTLDSVYYLTTRTKQTPDAQEIQREVDKVLDEQLRVGENSMRSRSTSTSSSDQDAGEIDLPLGKLNNSRRIDYVLQEAPLEFFNEYLFALTSHVCYWESEDTILFIIKEIYSLLGVNPDSQIPQQSMTIERPSSRKSINSNDA